MTTATGPISLEDGIQARFSGGKFKVGDCWDFAARTATGDVERLIDAPPRGTKHHYCRLALVKWAFDFVQDLTLKLNFEPTTVVGRGSSSKGTITLDPVPSNDAEAELSSDNPDLFPDLPQSVVILGGQSSTFEVHTPGPATGETGRARITASFAGASDTVELTVVVVG
jgi:hypothetical protein